MFSRNQFHQLHVHWCVVSFSQANPVFRLVGTKSLCCKVFCLCSWGPCLRVLLVLWDYIQTGAQRYNSPEWVWSIQSVHLLSFACSHWSPLKLIIQVQYGSMMQGAWIQWKIMLKNLSLRVISVWCIWTAGSCVMGRLLMDISQSTPCFAFSILILYMEVTD